ncbi:MAG: thiamine pyrophosphate-binding protein, partial [Candidatus Margulisiibacteriota bacterium]
MIKLSDYVFQYLAKLDIKHVFLLSGGGCMHLVDSLGRNQEIEYIPCLHEQVASIAAGAYAQYTNNLGVCLVTTGPGGTNAITGVAAAWADSIPLLVISGQVKRNDLALNTGLRFLGYQEIDIVSIVKPITKYAITVMEPQEIKYHLDKAISLATSGRKGPVWLDIPLDVQASLVDEGVLAGFAEEKITENTIRKLDDLQDQVKKTLKLLSEAKRPVIIAGYGIKLAEAKDQFTDLISRLNIPVLTTWKGMDLLPDEHPLFFGRPGCIGGRAPNFIQQNADLVISIGARLDYGQIGFDHKNFARAAK